MEITEVQVKLVGDSTERLKASCSITIDGEFVIRDVKVIEGTNGLFVAMPSRKLTDHCPKCRHKNHLRARFCNNCGAKLNENRASQRRRGATQLHADVAHPINSACRDRIQKRVVEDYQREFELSKDPDYRPKKLDAIEEAGAPETHAGETGDVEAGAPDAHSGEIGDLIEELKQDADKRRNSVDRPGTESLAAGKDVGGDSAGENTDAGASEAPTAGDQVPPPDETGEEDEDNGFGAGLL